MDKKEKWKEPDALFGCVSCGSPNYCEEEIKEIKEKARQQGREETEKEFLQKVEKAKKALYDAWFWHRKKGTCLSISRICGTINTIFGIKKELKKGEVENRLINETSQGSSHSSSGTAPAETLGYCHKCMRFKCICKTRGEKKR